MKLPLIKEELFAISLDKQSYLVQGKRNNYHIFNTPYANCCYVQDAFTFKDCLESSLFSDVSYNNPINLSTIITDVKCEKLVTELIVSRESLELLLKFSCNDDTRYYANGFVYKNGYLVASDAISLVRIKHNETKQLSTGIIPRYAISRFLKYSKAKHFALKVYETKALLVSIDEMLICNLIQGAYPPYEQIVEMDYQSFTETPITISAKEIAEAKVINKTEPWVTKASFGLKPFAHRIDYLKRILAIDTKPWIEKNGMLKAKKDNTEAYLVSHRV